tara:strand:+ start:441 stop:998 length:558 start_codon:yes stop_codon:yes gene_type:complete
MWMYWKNMWESDSSVVADSYYVDCVAKGSMGESVKLLQEALIEIGAGSRIESIFGADSDFGNDTYLDVKAFQKRWGLTADGVARKSTWKKLEEELNQALRAMDRSVQYTVSSKTCPTGYNPVTKTATPPGSPATKPEPKKVEIKKNGNGNGNGLPSWVVPVSVFAGVGLLVAIIAGTTRKRRRRA